MTKQRGSTIMIGDLLIAADLLSVSQISHTMPMSQKTGLPLGRVLVESGVIPLSIARAAILAQSLMHDNLLHMDLAAKAMRVVNERQVGLEEALTGLGWRSDYYERTNKLGDLLLAANCITEPQLADAFEVCFASGLPLGRVLILRQVLSEFVVYSALTAHILMRENKLTRQQAVETVKEAASRSGKVMISEEGRSIEGNAETLRLGELLIGAGLVSEIDLVSAVEQAIVGEDPIGEILLNSGTVGQHTLNLALQIQNKIQTGDMDPNEGIRMLRERGSSAAPVEPKRKSSVKRSPEEMSLSELLHSTGLRQDQDLGKLAHELLIQKEHMAFKIVSQQEEIKNTLARELHDTIIADLMMLKRYLSGDRKLTTEETIEIVDHVVRQLRDICWDFAPRQLQDLGLLSSLSDLLERMQERTGMRCQLVCAGQLRQLPEAVNLHIFRLLQECLNNVEKYSSASQVTLTVEEEDWLRFILVDDGRGFEPERIGERTESGGMGMGSMKERAELIRVYFPTKLAIQSQPGKGTRISLEIAVRK